MKTFVAASASESDHCGYGLTTEIVAGTLVRSHFGSHPQTTRGPGFIAAASLGTWLVIEAAAERFSWTRRPSAIEAVLQVSNFGRRGADTLDRDECH